MTIRSRAALPIVDGSAPTSASADGSLPGLTTLLTLSAPAWGLTNGESAVAPTSETSPSPSAARNGGYCCVGKTPFVLDSLAGPRHVGCQSGVIVGRTKRLVSVPHVHHPLGVSHGFSRVSLRGDSFPWSFGGKRSSAQRTVADQPPRWRGAFGGLLEVGLEQQSRRSTFFNQFRSSNSNSAEASLPKRQVFATDVIAERNVIGPCELTAARPGGGTHGFGRGRRGRLVQCAAR